MANPSVAVDFDGVIHPYTKGWIGVTPDPEPPDPHVPIVLATLARRFKVIVFSARASFPEGKAGIEEWLKANRLDRFVSDVTATKPAAVAFLDDRAVPFTGDWSAALAGIEKLAKTPSGPVVAQPRGTP